MASTATTTPSCRTGMISRRTRRAPDQSGSPSVTGRPSRWATGQRLGRPRRSRCPRCPPGGGGAVSGRTCATHHQGPLRERHPQGEVGEREVGEQLPVGHQPPGMVDVRAGWTPNPGSGAPTGCSCVTVAHRACEPRSGRHHRLPAWSLRCPLVSQRRRRGARPARRLPPDRRTDGRGVRRRRARPPEYAPSSPTSPAGPGGGAAGRPAPPGTRRRQRRAGPRRRLRRRQRLRRGGGLPDAGGRSGRPGSGHRGTAGEDLPGPRAGRRQAARW